jgi:hypothetical protein
MASIHCVVCVSHVQKKNKSLSLTLKRRKTLRIFTLRILKLLIHPRYHECFCVCFYMLCIVQQCLSAIPILYLLSAYNSFFFFLTLYFCSFRRCGASSIVEHSGNMAPKSNNRCGSIIFCNTSQTIYFLFLASSVVTGSDQQTSND